MLSLQTFTFNAFQENTFLIINAKNHCWIVDPGMYEQQELDQFFAHIEKQQLKPQAVINTHTHLDHIFGVQACKKKYGIPFLMHEKDVPVLSGGAGSAMLFGFQLELPVPDGFIQEGVRLRLDEDELEVRLAPGHSPGSIIFYYAPGDWVIGGDVLFNGSIGRTDLPGGNYDTLIHSIRTQLFTLPGGTTVYSGHGPITTIAREQSSNPFLQS